MPRVLFIVMTLLCVTPLCHAADDPAARATLRRPVAIAVSDGRVITANERTGSVSIVDPDAKRVTREVVVGQRLADLVTVPGADGVLLAVDSKADELIVLRHAGDDVAVTQRVLVRGTPVSVCLSPGGGACSVASLWAHRITLMLIKPGRSAAQSRVDNTNTDDAHVIDPAAARVIDLPFAPREQWWGGDGTMLIVADSFAGNLAVIDTRDVATARLRFVRSIHGHNIRGLATSPNGAGLMISHQMLDPRVPTTERFVFYGFVIGNFVREVAFSELLCVDDTSAESPHPIHHWSLFPLGTQEHGAGDPDAVVVTPRGATVVAMMGVDEVSVRRRPLGDFVRVEVGDGPSGIALSPDARQAYVANRFGDSISVVDIDRAKLVTSISLGDGPKIVGLSDRGEALFHDAKLSLDGWYSCHSCHTDGHSNGLLNDNLSDDTFDTPKRVLPLGNVMLTEPWAWNGMTSGIRGQVRKSIEVTMRHTTKQPVEQDTIEAIVAYLQTLTPPPSLARARGDLDAARFERGRAVFERFRCVRCHQPDTYSSHDVLDVGLRDEAGLREFNPPALLGVSQRPTLFHDGRARSTREVITKFEHEGVEGMTDAERDDLLEFLRGL
ncbi:MAG: YVTN family beta-propeller domain-containing protein [Phycisphaera sp.]|nr:YVTN family beta-propeller domain-containing protein [Phycisphaera sp.]